MAKKINKELNDFIKSDDYRDICYFIEHIRNQDIRNSCCEELGYTIGINILDVKKDKAIVPKSVIKGTKGEFRVVSFVDLIHGIAECIICRK